MSNKVHPAAEAFESLVNNGLIVHPAPTHDTDYLRVLVPQRAPHFPPRRKQICIYMIFMAERMETTNVWRWAYYDVEVVQLV